jgi:hypothetical protein
MRDLFGWAFGPAFAFAKAKSQPKDPKSHGYFYPKAIFVLVQN